MKPLEGKAALVTAATRGIGLACACRLAQEGAFVLLGGRSPQRGEEAAAAIRRQGGQAAFVYFDAAHPETYAPMVEEAAAHRGRLDILVNNFGTTDARRDLDLLTGDPAAFFAAVSANLQSVYLPSRAAAPHMARQGGGAIVNISSIGGAVADVTRLGYSVSKAAVNALTQNMALQLAHLGIRVNAVLPGMVATQAVLANLPAQFQSQFLAHVPLGRLGQPEEIAAAVSFLAGPDGAYLTGALLPAAGGFGLGTALYRRPPAADGPAK